MSSGYLNPGPSEEDIKTSDGPLILEFGTDWCGFCKASAPIIEEGLVTAGSTPRIKVEDGKGRRLGRAFKVKLWPTVIFLRDGVEICRLERPQTVEEVKRCLDELL